MVHVRIGKTPPQIKNWHLFTSWVLASQAANSRCTSVLAGGATPAAGSTHMPTNQVPTVTHLAKTACPNLTPTCQAMEKRSRLLPRPWRADECVGAWHQHRGTQTGSVRGCAMGSVAAFLRRCLPSLLRSLRSALSLGILQRVLNRARGAGRGAGRGRSEPAARAAEPSHLSGFRRGRWNAEVPRRSCQTAAGFAARSTTKSTEAGTLPCAHSTPAPSAWRLYPPLTGGRLPWKSTGEKRPPCCAGQLLGGGGRRREGGTAQRGAASSAEIRRRGAVPRRPSSCPRRSCDGVGAPLAHVTARGSQGRIAALGKERLTRGFGTAVLAVLFSLLPFHLWKEKKNNPLDVKEVCSPCATRNEMSIQGLAVAVMLLAMNSCVPSQGSADSQLLPALGGRQDSYFHTDVPRGNTRLLFHRLVIRS